MYHICRCLPIYREFQNTTIFRAFGKAVPIPRGTADKDACAFGRGGNTEKRGNVNKRKNITLDGCVLETNACKQGLVQVKGKVVPWIEIVWKEKEKGEKKKKKKRDKCNTVR